jgi:chromosome partitioning protein
MKIIASYNVKGGVGKTATAVNLAYLSAAEGRRTLIWDLDPQAAATFLFRVRPKVKGGSEKLVRGRSRIGDAVKGTDFENLDLLPADFTYRNMDIDLVGRPRPTRTMRRLLAPLAKDYDVVILDTPPSLSLVSENVLHAADLVLVPIIPTVLSVRTFDQLTGFVKGFKGRKPRLLGFFSMVDRRRALHREIVASLPVERRWVSETVIPSASIVEQMAVRRAPVAQFAPRSPASAAYRRLWAEVSAEVWPG